LGLFDNPKTSDYTELNVRLIILEKMFKNFLSDNNATIDKIKQIINGLGCFDEYFLKDFYEGQIKTYLPTFPNILNTYRTVEVYYSKGNNVLFQYYNTAIAVYMKEDRTEYTHS
jgi:hypothetical protein